MFVSAVHSIFLFSCSQNCLQICTRLSQCTHNSQFCMHWLKLKDMSSAQNKSHRHVIHVCTCAFLLFALYAFDTHIFFVDPFIKNNLSGHVADQQTLRHSAKRGVSTEDETVSLPGREQVDYPARGEDHKGYLHGKKGRSQSSDKTDDSEVRNVCRSIEGTTFAVITLNRELTFMCPQKNHSQPIPLRCILMGFRVNTNVDVLLEICIDVCRNVHENWNYRNFGLVSRTPDGYVCVWRWLTQNSNNIKCDHCQKFLSGVSKAVQRRERAMSYQNWTNRESWKGTASSIWRTLS